MRWVAAALALLLLPPLASAAPDLFRLEADAMPAKLEPLRDTLRIPLRLFLSCAIVGQGADVLLAVDGAPAWARAQFSPDRHHVDGIECQSGATEVRRDGDVAIQVTDDAPAGRVAAFDVVARVSTLLGQREARAPVEVTAGWFSVLEVQIPDAIAVIEPGGEARFAVTLRNLGNGAALVEVEVRPRADGRLGVDPVAPVRLESLQESGPGASDARVVEVVVRAPHEEGFVNRVESFDVTLAARRVDGSEAGDTGHVSFVVTTRTPLLEREAPGPGAGLLAFALAGVAVAARRSRRAAGDPAKPADTTRRS